MLLFFFYLKATMTMFNYKSKLMSSFLLKAAFVFLFIQCCFSAPIDPQYTPYSSFVMDLTRNNCTLPSQIPLSFGANETTIEAALLICNTPDYLKFTKEVPVLCNEIFGLLKNISCSPLNAALPKIQVPLSTDVCNDFQSYKTVLPKGLLEHLSDSFDCKLMCSDNFETPCKVLLWSFLVQNQIINTGMHETLKTTKNAPVTETKTTTNLQTNLQIKESNDEKSQVDNFQKPEIKVDVKNSELDEKSNTALNPKEPKKLTNILQEKLTKPDTAAPEDIAQETSIKNPVVGAEQVETKFDNVSKIKLVIPINSSLDVSAKQDKDETILDGDLVNNNHPSLVSKVPQDQTAPANNADTEPQPKIPAVSKEGNSQISDNAKENDLMADTKSLDNLEAGNAASDSQMGSIITVPNYITSNGITSKTDQISDVSEKKDEDSAVLPVEKLSTNPPIEPTVDSVSVVVSGGMSENIPSPTPVISMTVTPSLEKMEDEIPLPNEKEADQYNLDNAEGDLDGEYSKQEYGDGGMYDPTKNKESISETPKSVDVPKESVVSQSDEIKAFNGLSSRGSFGRGSEEIQEFAAFPDQEDSHFFFYFLSIVLILMAGYLIFHNKQKIIALIVEGRHERRRRSHGLGYKKLETK